MKGSKENDLVLRIRIRLEIVRMVFRLFLGGFQLSHHPLVFICLGRHYWGSRDLWLGALTRTGPVSLLLVESSSSLLQVLPLCLRHPLFFNWSSNELDIPQLVFNRS